MRKLLAALLLTILAPVAHAVDVTVQWQRITQDTSTPPQPVTVASYNIFVDGVLNSNFVPVNTNTNQFVVLQGFAAGQTITFGVQAVADSGEVSATGEATITIPTGVPQTPIVEALVDQ